MAHAYVFGLLSARCSNAARKTWNALLRERGVDGFFDFYPTETQQDLELRLAEMFHLGRRAYILAEPLRKIVLPLLDRVEKAAQKDGIDTIINEGGVLVGYHLSDLPPSDQLTLWMAKSTSSLSD